MKEQCKEKQEYKKILNHHTMFYLYCIKIKVVYINDY